MQQRRDGKGILIVEDSKTQAFMLENFLNEQDFDVYVAGNGREALELLQEIRPAIVISDIIMPEMDGYDLCKKIKDDEKLKNIVVILLT